MSEAQQVLEKSLIHVIPGLITLLSGLLSALIIYATTSIASRTKNEKVKEALDRLSGVVQDAVKDAQQRIIGAIPADATNLEEVLVKAKLTAMDSVKSHYGEKGIKELKTVLGWDDFEKNLSTKIEAAVHDMKLETKGS